MWGFVCTLGLLRVTLAPCRCLRGHLPTPPTPLAPLVLYRCMVQDVVFTMAEKLGQRNPADDCLHFGLHECKDGVTGEGIVSAVPALGTAAPLLPPPPTPASPVVTRHCAV